MKRFFLLSLMRSVFAILLLFSIHRSFAQIPGENVLSPADKNILAQIKRAKEYTRRVDELQKQIRQARNTLRKDSIQYERSLKRIARDSVTKFSSETRDTLDVGVFIESCMRDLSGADQLAGRPGEQLRQLQTSRQKYTQCVGLLDSAMQAKPPDIDSLRSMLSDAMEKRAEHYLREYEKELSRGNKNVLSNGQATAAASAAEQPNQLKAAAIPRSTRKLKDHFSGHLDKIASVQSKLAKYQKKYSHVQSAKDLMADPPNPLHDKTFGERLFGGMNFNVVNGEPLIADLSPFIAYRLNTKFSTGVALLNRMNFYSHKKYQIHVVTNDAYGFRYFGEYNSGGGLLGYAEFEEVRRKLSNLSVDGFETGWKAGLYLGAGKVFKLSKKLKGQILILYNFLQEEQSLMPKSFSFRVGIRIP